MFDALQRRMPHARVVNAGAGITFLQLRKIQSRAEMLAFAVEDRRESLRGEILEGITDGQDQGVIEGIALARTSESDDGDGPPHFE